MAPLALPGVVPAYGLRACRDTASATRLSHEPVELRIIRLSIPYYPLD
jgi:hypothetical protein